MSFSQSGSLPKDLAERLMIGLDDAAQVIGQELVKHVRDKILGGPKSGRHYSGLPNQSSAPGEYSANQSGDLLNSIDFSVIGGGLGGGYVIDFFATSDHAGYQEYGTSKMGARPNLKMTLDEVDPFIQQCLEEVMARALGGG